MRRTIAALVSTLVSVAACAESPTSQPSAALRDAPVPGEFSVLGMNVAPPVAGTPKVLLSFVVDPFDPNTVTYTFDDLPWNCVWDGIMPDPYDDLDFTTTPYMASGCWTPNGTNGLIPANSFGWTFPFATHETRFTLPFPASFVSIQSYSYAGVSSGTLVGYDGAGVALASATFNDPYSYYYGGETVSIAAAGIKQVGLIMYQNTTYLDNLKITYKKDPTNKDQCKDGGWEAYGFKNQGQCVRFVETGKDSRTG